MKNKDLFSLSALFFCTAVLSFSIAFFLFVQNNIAIDHNSAKNNTTSSSDLRTKYTVGEFNGKIAVYYDNNVVPDEIYDAYLNSLPKEDVSSLNEGITVYSKKEVQKLIEDYTS